MADSEPYSILDDFPGWSTEFSPLWRQEYSRQANGVTRVKDIGDALWQATYTSANLNRRTLDYWRARLNQLYNGEMTFYGYAMSRRYPMAYPRGAWPALTGFDGTNAAVAALGTDGKSLSVSGLPHGFALSVGDHIQVNTADLYQVMAIATASSGGTTGTFEVFPPLRATTAEAQAVSVKQPHCLMMLTPDSVVTTAQLNGLGTVTFSAVEARTSA